MIDFIENRYNCVSYNYSCLLLLTQTLERKQTCTPACYSVFLRSCTDSNSSHPVSKKKET